MSLLISWKNTRLELSISVAAAMDEPLIMPFFKGASAAGDAEAVGDEG